MSTGSIVAIVVVVIVVIVVVALVTMQVRKRNAERRRVQAQEHRREAEVRGARADQLEAEAAERQARADREAAVAREQAARATEDRQAAEEARAHSHRLDPDAAADRRPPDAGPADAADTTEGAPGRVAGGRGMAEPAKPPAEGEVPRGTGRS